MCTTGNIWNVHLLYMFWGWHAAKNVLIIRWIIMSIFCVKNFLCFVNESFDPLSNPLPLPPRLVCLCSGRTLGVYACGPHWCSLFILLFKRKPLSMAVWSLTGSGCWGEVNVQALVTCAATLFSWLLFWTVSSAFLISWEGWVNLKISTLEYFLQQPWIYIELK